MAFSLICATVEGPEGVAFGGENITTVARTLGVGAGACAGAGVSAAGGATAAGVCGIAGVAECVGCGGSGRLYAGRRVGLCWLCCCCCASLGGSVPVGVITARRREEVEGVGGEEDTGVADTGGVSVCGIDDGGVRGGRAGGVCGGVLMVVVMRILSPLSPLIIPWHSSD